MSRIKNQEIMRRLSVASRTSEEPGLTVQAAMDSSRGHSALGIVAAGALTKASGVFLGIQADRQKSKNAADDLAGSQRKTEEDIGGVTDSTALTEEHSVSWRRGYLKNDATLKIRDWQRTVMAEVSKLEPGEDINAILQERSKELLENPEFADPEVRKALLPALNSSVAVVRDAHAKSELSETVMRSEESMMGVMAAGIEDGSLLTPTGMAKVYEYLDSEEFAYLNKADVDKLFARAAVGALETGEQPPERILEFLKAKRADGTPGVYGTLDANGQPFSVQIDNAAAAGQRVIDKRDHENQQRALGEMELGMQGAVKRGQATTGAIIATLAKAGITPESNPQEYVSNLRYWTNQQDAQKREWEAEARTRRAEAAAAKAVAGGNPFANSNAQNQKLAQRDWDAAPEGQKGRVLQKWMALGTTVPFVENILQRALPGSPGFEEAGKLYSSLRTMNQSYAAMHVNAGTALALETYHRDVTERGISPSASIQALQAVRSQTRPEYGRDIREAMKDAAKKIPGLDTMTGEQKRRVEEQAVRYMLAANGGVPADAVQVAMGTIQAQYVTVAGRQVPRATMPRGGEKGTEAFISAVGNTLVRAGKLTEQQREDLYAAPDPHNPQEWVVFNKGFPVIDETDGQPFAFGPRSVAAKHQEWQNAVAGEKTRKGAAYRAAFPNARPYKLNEMLDPSADVAYDNSMKAFPQSIAAATAERDKTNPASSDYAARSRRVDAMTRDYDRLKTAGGGVKTTPEFLEFLQGQ